MELPENLREEFEKFDIPVIYGMEWLKKNGFGEEKNKRIVRKNPFLPYSLILTQQELKKLSEKKGETWFLLVRMNISRKIWLSRKSNSKKLTFI